MDEIKPAVANLYRDALEALREHDAEYHYTTPLKRHRVLIFFIPIEE
jgi:hypothetical protein